jgi:RNA recognition motif-containing protein
MLIEITNLNLNWIEADVRRLFYPFGEIGSVHLFRDGRNNRFSGKAHVEMPVKNEAHQAISALHGKILIGKSIYLLELPSKTEETALGASI